MTVKQLIARLQKMPQNLQVVYAHGDNSEWETAGDIIGVLVLDKDEIKPPYQLDKFDQERYDSMPKRQVVIRGVNLPGRLVLAPLRRGYEAGNHQG